MYNARAEVPSMAANRNGAGKFIRCIFTLLILWPYGAKGNDAAMDDAMMKDRHYRDLFIFSCIRTTFVQFATRVIHLSRLRDLYLNHYHHHHHHHHRRHHQYRQKHQQHRLFVNVATNFNVVVMLLNI
uniref:Uncharacterized protein n=1 Tax=Glossina pallidipes TaxID=7398 RepID=A0A1A9Z768_GLOPL